MKKKFYPIITFMLALSIGLELGECLVRWVAPRKLVRPYIVNDPGLGVRGKANSRFTDDWLSQYYTAIRCPFPGFTSRKAISTNMGMNCFTWQ
jgi:hypothetical protein